MSEMASDEDENIIPFQLQFDKPIPFQIKIAAWNPEKDLLAMVTEDSKIMLHRFNWQRLWTISPGKPVTSLCWRPHGKAIAVGLEDGTIALHDNGKLLRNLKPHDVAVVCLNWEEDGQSNTSLKLKYDGKRDRWNGYDSSTYHRVQELYDAKDARKKYLKDEKLKKLEEKHKHQEVNDPTSDWDEEDDDLRVDESKVDGSKQMDFAKVEKRVRSTDGGSTGTVRNLRIREDKAKYLYNLDVDSAHYDPKSRSMREDPLPDADPNQKFYSGDNGYRNSDHALEFKQLNILSWEAFDMIQDMHMQAAPSRAEFLYKKVKAGKDKLKSQTKDAIMGKYGNAATQDEIPMELLLGQSERQVEYDRAGRILKGQEVEVLPKNKYKEDVHVNNHNSVWGSWWKGHKWGYKCCQLTVRNSYCTGSAGIEAAEDLMKGNVAARKEACEGNAKEVGEKRMATWGTDIPEDVELSEEALANALKKEDERKREEKDERKRKYNVKYNNDVTREEMEAYRMQRVHQDDPLKALSSSSGSSKRRRRCASKV
ncbi:WD40-repeat-containing domain superfamily [Arabidopsis thaliana x Arabidopsis arenosa]|uniref:Pre-mRNA-splicing factor SLU7 n=1 Tax=Arabidopsis thaliana x Arabidopsis arenosa TaxID=1240361 RepID=A0A8T1YC33_9BRAS|nr:WD40-repeat-containing domain superfamily [Arabidopsis thaliana x Arabidopsis arenosa]